MTSDKENQRQSEKEKAVLLALRNGIALIRRNLEIHGMKTDGSTEFISESKDYDNLWFDALKSLEKRFKKEFISQELLQLSLSHHPNWKLN